MGSMKMSKILTLGVLEAEKLQTRRWLKCCGTPCIPISSLGDIPLDTVVTLLAVVQDVGDIVEFISRGGKDFKKREVVLYDNSMLGSTVELVLWNEQAEQFTHSAAAVIAIKGAKVTEFNEKRNIYVGFCGSYEVNPAISEAVELRRNIIKVRGMTFK